MKLNYDKSKESIELLEEMKERYEKSGGQSVCTIPFGESGTNCPFHPRCFNCDTTSTVKYKKVCKRLKELREKEVVFKPRYSGDKSRKFWDKIDKLNHESAYSLGVALQDIESSILRQLNSIKE
jgi:hypothetical protein